MRLPSEKSRLTKNGAAAPADVPMIASFCGNVRSFHLCSIDSPPRLSGVEPKLRRVSDFERCCERTLRVVAESCWSGRSCGPTPPSAVRRRCSSLRSARSPAAGRFGVHVHMVGDNPDAAQQMGINVKPVRRKTFAFVGLVAAFAGVAAVMINCTWRPTSGDGYLLPALAPVFVGGTAPWGGIGTIIGSAIGSFTVSFIRSGAGTRFAIAGLARHLEPSPR